MNTFSTIMLNQLTFKSSSGKYCRLGAIANASHCPSSTMIRPGMALKVTKTVLHMQRHDLALEVATILLYKCKCDNLYTSIYIQLHFALHMCLCHPKFVPPAPKTPIMGGKRGGYFPHLSNPLLLTLIMLVLQKVMPLTLL